MANEIRVKERSIFVEAELPVRNNLLVALVNREDALKSKLTLVKNETANVWIDSAN